MNWKKTLVSAGIAVIALTIISAALTLLKIGFLQALRIVFGSTYVLFLPGFVLTYVFFKEIDWIERIALSFALSIATVPLILFYLNKLGIKINLLSSTLTILGIIIVGIGIKVLLIRKNREQSKAKIAFKPKKKI